MGATISTAEVGDVEAKDKKIVAQAGQGLSALFDYQVDNLVVSDAFAKVFAEEWCAKQQFEGEGGEGPIYKRTPELWAKLSAMIADAESSHQRVEDFACLDPSVTSVWEETNNMTRLQALLRTFAALVRTHHGGNHHANTYNNSGRVEHLPRDIFASPVPPSSLLNNDKLALLRPFAALESLATSLSMAAGRQGQQIDARLATESILDLQAKTDKVTVELLGGKAFPLFGRAALAEPIFKHAQQLAASSKGPVRSAALALMLSVVLATGDLGSMLELAAALEAGSEALPPASLRQLAQLALEPGPRRCDLVVPAYPAVEAFKGQVVERMEQGNSGAASLCTDGAHLFVWDGTRLLKMATGLLGTSQHGQIMATNETISTADVDSPYLSLALVGARLYLRSAKRTLVLSAFSLAEEGVAGPLELEPASEPTNTASSPTVHTLVSEEGQVLDVRCLPGGKMEVQSATLHGPDEALDVTASVARLLQDESTRLYFNYSGHAAVSDWGAHAESANGSAAAAVDEHSIHLSITIVITPANAGSVAMHCAPPALMTSDGRALVMLTRSLVPATSPAVERPYIEPERDIRITSAYFHKKNFGGGECLAKVQGLWTSFLAGTLSPIVASEEVIMSSNTRAAFDHYPPTLAVGDIVRRGPNWSYSDQDTQGGTQFAGVVIQFSQNNVVRVEWRKNLASSDSFHTNSYHYKPEKYDVYKVNPAFPPTSVPPSPGAVSGVDSPVAGGASSVSESTAKKAVLYVNCLVGKDKVCFAFPEGTTISFDSLLEASATRLAGLKVVLSAVVLDPETRASATLPLQDSALSLSSLQRLGAETVLLFNGRLLLVQQCAGASVFQSYRFDLGDKGSFLGVSRNHFPKEIGTPAALAFDRRSNFVYSYDPATLLFQRWRNSGLPPTASLLSSPGTWDEVISRGDAYECANALLREEVEAGAAGASSPRRQAVLLHALLAQRSQDAYAALSMRLPAAEADLRGMVVLSSRGRRKDHKEVGHGISVRGVAPLINLDDLSDVPAGYYVCALAGANFSDVLGMELFDLAGEQDGSKGEAMANFIEDQEEGVAILITTVGDASCALTSRALEALGSIGLAAPDRLLPRKGKSQWPSGVCSLACIGRKGADLGSAEAVIADGGDLVILKARIPTLAQPLLCDPGRIVLANLTQRCVSAVGRIKQAPDSCPDSCDLVELVSCLKVLTVNISSLALGTPQETVLSLMDAETRTTLLQLLRGLIYPPLECPGGHTIANCAVDAFFVCQSLVESAVSDLLVMLFTLLQQKHASSDGVSPELDVFLNLLLERLSTSDAISKLLQDETASADTNNLVKALMEIIKDDTTLSIEKLGGGVEVSSQSAAKLLYPLLLGLASKAVLLFVSSGSDASQRAGLNLFLDVLSEVAGLSYHLIAFGRECSNRVSPGELVASIDDVLQNSPVRTILPTLLLSLSSLVSMYGPRMLALEQGRVVAVAEMILAGHRELLQVLAQVPQSSLHRTVFVETSVPVATTVSQTYEAESSHPYASSLDLRKQYEFKNATSIKVCFDPRSKTEKNYDWLCFQSVDGSIDYSPKFSGRDASDWPGAAPGVEPFVLPAGVKAFSTMMHSDGSNEDWGYKLTMTVTTSATALETQTDEVDVKHWCVVLAEQHELVLAQLAGSLIAGRPLHNVWEDPSSRPGLAASYLDDPVVSMQVLCPEVPPPYESEEERLLVDLIERPEGSLAHKLVASMRRDRNLQDQGQPDIMIENVVYGTCAAAIKHNNLVHEALAIAKGTRVAQVSAPFKLAWKTSQKMRQYLLQPGMNVELQAGVILEKVRFLLRSGTRVSSAGSEKAAMDKSPSLPNPAKQRWALLRQNMTAAVQEPRSPRRNVFAGLVSKLAVHERLQKLKLFRKRLAEKNRPLSTNERVLQFLQDQNIEPSQLSQLLALRTSRAEARAHGFGLCCQLLQMRAAGNLGNGNGSTSTSSESDSGHAWTAHVCKAIRQSCTQAGKTHALSFLQGVSAAHTERVKEAYAAFLARCFALVEALPAPSPLAVGCLQACAMDHGVGDLRAINSARVVPILGALLSSPDEGLSTLADSLLQIVISGGGSSRESSAAEDGGKFSADIEAFAVSMSQVLAAKVGEMGSAQATISNLVWPEQQGEKVFDGVYSLHADTGYTIPVATSGSISGGGRTYSCWIMRPARAALDDDASPLCEGDVVMRSAMWTLRGQLECADEDGGVGGLGCITALKDDDMAEVQWRCGGDLHTVSVSLLTRACDSLGGHIFSQGASALKEGGCTVGLALLPDASLCAFVSSGSPATISTVRGQCSVPPNQWVHVALTVTKSAVCTIRVDGLVSAEEMLGVPKRTEKKIFESAHPYPHGADEWTTIAFPSQFKNMSVTFSEETKTESGCDYVTFYTNSSHSARYGKEKYSGRDDSRNFPGLEKEPALVIPSNTCELYFHSDGSVNDWGWKLTAVAENPGFVPKLDKCDGPVHVGALPFFALHTIAPALKCSMTGLVARLSVVDEDAGWEAALPDQVEREDIHKCAVNKLATVYKGGYKCDVCATDGNCFLSKVYHCEQCGWDCHARCMEAMLRPAPLVPPRDAITLLDQRFQLSVLELLSKTVGPLSVGGSLLAGEINDSYVVQMHKEMSRVLVTNPSIVLALLHVCAGSISPLIKGYAFKILCRILPCNTIQMVETHAASSKLTGSSGSIMEALLLQAGRLVALDAFADTTSRRGERHAEEGIESSLLALLRALAVSSYAGLKESAGAAWSAAVGAFIKAECGRVSALLESLRDVEAPMPQDRASLDAAYGLLAFLGGALQSACTPGARALYLREGSLTEPCTVLAPAHVPAPSAESPSSASDAALWKDLNSFGEAVAVCLDSTPKKQKVVPARNLRFVDQRPDDAHFSAFLAEHVGEEALCRLFQRVAAIHATDSRPLLGSLSSKEDAVKEFESNHPYADNERFYQTITLDPSVKEVQISFSELCATEGGCDYLVFYKDSSHTSKWGKDKYTGRKGDAWGDACWKEPLTIPSHTFVVHFYSDGSSTDWGWKFKASFTQRMDVVPPSFPLDPLLLPRAHLKMVGAKALRSVLQSSEWFTRALARSHELSSAVISAALQPSSCLVLERELSRKCADVYLCSATATGRTTTFTALSEAALHSCVFAQQMLREGRSLPPPEAAAAAGGMSAPQQRRLVTAPRVLRLSGVTKANADVNALYVEDQAASGLVFWAHEGCSSVVIANVTGPNEALINGTYSWNAAEKDFQKTDRSMIIEYSTTLPMWIVKSIAHKGKDLGNATMAAASDAVAIWDLQVPLLVAADGKWPPQPQATVTRASSPLCLEFVVTNEATGAGRWEVNVCRLFCEAADASLPMDPSCQWKRRTSDEPDASTEDMQGVRAVLMTFPEETDPNTQEDFLTPLQRDEEQGPCVKAHDIPTSLQLSGYTGALADEVNGVWDLVPPNDKRRSEPQQQLLTKRGQALSIVYCPAVKKHLGCGPDCSESHSNSDCLKCGEGWGTHSGHNCSNSRGRGSWPLPASDSGSVSTESRKFKIVRQGAGGKPLAELSVEAVLDRLRIATPAGAAPEDESPLNRVGVPMKLDSDGNRFYCSRQLGRDVVGQGSDGQCGPNNGPQCPDCRGFSVSNPPEKQSDGRLEALLRDVLTLFFCPALLSSDQWLQCVYPDGDDSGGEAGYEAMTLSLVAPESQASATEVTPRAPAFDTSFSHPMHAVDNSAQAAGAAAPSDVFMSKQKVYADEPEAVLSYLSIRASENLLFESLLHVLSRWPKDEAPSMGFFGGLGRLLQLVEELLRPEEGAVVPGTGAGTGMEVARASVMALFRQLCVQDASIVERVSAACCAALLTSCKKPGSDESTFKVYETPHPLPAGACISLPIAIPDAAEVSIAFDPRSLVRPGDRVVIRPGPGCCVRVSKSKEASLALIEISPLQGQSSAPFPPLLELEGNNCVIELTTSAGEPSWGFSCVVSAKESESRRPQVTTSHKRLGTAIRLLDCIFRDTNLCSLPALYSASLFDALVQAYASSPEAISCGLSDLLITITRAVLHAPTSALAAMPPSVLAALRAVKARTLGTLPSKKVGEPGDYHPETQAQAQLVIYLGEAISVLEGAQKADTQADEDVAGLPSWLPHLELSADIMRAAATGNLPEAVVTSRFLPLCSANARVVLEVFSFCLASETRSELVNIDSAEGLLVVLRSLALKGEGSVEVLDGAGRVVSVLADPVPSRAVRKKAIASFLFQPSAEDDPSNGVVVVDGPSLTIRTRPGGHFKLEVIPRFALETARAMAQFQPLLDALKLEFCGSPRADAVLVQYICQQASKRNWSLQHLLESDWSEIAPSEESDDLVSLPKLKALLQTPPQIVGLYSWYDSPEEEQVPGQAATQVAADSEALEGLAAIMALDVGTYGTVATETYDEEDESGLAGLFSGGGKSKSRQRRRAVEAGGTIMRIVGSTPMPVREGHSIDSTILYEVPVGETIEVLPATLLPIAGQEMGSEITRVQVAGGGWSSWRWEGKGQVEVFLEEVRDADAEPMEPERKVSPEEEEDEDAESDDDDDLCFAAFDPSYKRLAAFNPFDELNNPQSRGLAGGSGSGSEPTVRAHVGEWREGRGYCCAIDSDSLKDSKFLCKHEGGIIQGRHWSCCGARDKDAAGCGGAKDSEASPAASVEPPAPLVQTRPACCPAEARFNLLVRLNASLVQALPLVNLLLCDPSSTGAGAVGHGGAASLPLARLLSTCRELLFSGLRDPVWTRALAATEVPSDDKFELKLSRSRAAKYAALGQPDTGGRWTVFSQAFRQMHALAPSSLRRGNQLYRTLLMGEHSIDAGGPFRESFGMYWQELQSPLLSLLIKCPNALETNGTDRDCWRLNPSATSAVELEMFAFMGKLLGLAIRGKNYVPLALAPLMWKLIIGETPTLGDLKGVDFNKIKSMLDLRDLHLKHEDFTAEMFTEVFPDLFFTTIDPSGSSEVEVVPGGAQRAVTFENRGEYVDAVMRYKIHEYDTQVRAVRQGLGTIVPLHTLSLLTHDAVERLVCGNPEVDLALLKRCCKYDGCEASNAHVLLLWQALEEFSQEERSAFLRFVWGRSRLPLSEDDFSQRFKIASFGRAPADSFLPVSHTCFFTLDLPTYSTLDIMKQRLRYAIFNCTEVDGDSGGSGVDCASLGWEE